MNDEIVKRKFSSKLGECLVYERTVLRLYEDLIGNCDRSPELILVQDELVHYLDEAREHVDYLDGLREEAGAAGPGSSGYTVVEAVAQALQALMTDSQTPVIQGLEVVLVAELVNASNWQLLADIAEKLERKPVSVHLKNRGMQKQDHADGIRLIIHELYVRENHLGD